MRRDADGGKGGDGLGAPRRAGLAVAGKSFESENTADIRRPAAFPADEFRNPIQPTALRQILRRRGMDRVKVGVVADVMAFERGDDILAAALFQHARLFPDDFERGSDILGGEQLAEPQRRIIVPG